MRRSTRIRYKRVYIFDGHRPLDFWMLFQLNAAICVRLFVICCRCFWHLLHKSTTILIQYVRNFPICVMLIYNVKTFRDVNTHTHRTIDSTLGQVEQQLDSIWLKGKSHLIEKLTMIFNWASSIFICKDFNVQCYS